ncbi:glycosyltransferase family 39 protein [Streptomyces sp. NPDC002889]|uniref:glycosyltransferase family 39 protein n=1 Tax=Streptomyces sp. NPDC002889 TaxID=3364669 RepID=UPI003696AF9C
MNDRRNERRGAVPPQHVHTPRPHDPYDDHPGSDAFTWFPGNGTGTGAGDTAPPAPGRYDQEQYSRDEYGRHYAPGTYAQHQYSQGYPQGQYIQDHYGRTQYVQHPWPSYGEQHQAPQPAPAGPATHAPTAPWATQAVPGPEPDSPKEQPERAYHIPQTPEAGWDMGASRRRAWVSRAVLLCILAIQMVLSLRLDNTAFQDEALYLSAGHAQLDGTGAGSDYAGYFSGSPALYPVLAALVDAQFGLTGARVLSLVFMLGTTALLYAITRRLFNERVALAGAALFSVVQSTVVLGWFATYDAPAVFLLALAAWIVVRTDRAPALAVLAAAPVAVLAVGVKYAAGLYLPTLIALAVLTAWPHRRGGSVLRGIVLAAGIALLLGAGLAFSDVLDGVRATTTDRDAGSDSAAEVWTKSALWGGLMFVTACAGALSYTRRGRMNESPLSFKMSGPGWRWRAVLGLVLCATALLAPLYQAHLSTTVALYKHLGFGLLFAAPMAGVGISRLVGAHFRYPQLGIMLWVAVLCTGLAQSVERFASWPQATQLTKALKEHVTPQGRYLASTPNVPVYYLREQTDQSRWTSLYGIGYKDAQGRMHRGEAGYRTAIKDGWFDMVVLDGVANPAMDEVVIDALKKSGKYRLLGSIPFTAGGQQGTYRIWVKA